jgi:transposase
MPGLKHLFTSITNPRQRQYEAVRAIEIDNLSVADAAKKFDYQINTLYSIIRDIKAGKIELFPSRTEKVSKIHTPSYIVEQAIQFRKQNLSAKDIAQLISEEGYKVAVRTIERILANAGLPKLKRRTHVELGLTRKAQQLPECAFHLIRSSISVLAITKFSQIDHANPNAKRIIIWWSPFCKKKIFYVFLMNQHLPQFALLDEQFYREVHQQ